jgi:alpha-L-fucosidase
MTVLDPDAEPFNTDPRGQGPAVLTLHLPVQRPDVLVPVVELFPDAPAM